MTNKIGDPPASVREDAADFLNRGELPYWDASGLPPVEAFNNAVRELRIARTLVRALLADHGGAGQADGWQAIESAPKNEVVFFWIVPKTAEESYTDTSGTPIVVNHAPYFKHVTFGMWGALSKATHWRPSFAAPLPSTAPQ